VQESTEDAQKFADVAALEQPYMEIGFTTSASAPFVAPLVDVTGLIIHFSVAVKGTLL
jgi:Mg/Co/Ni transporter MgtE